MYLWPGVSKTFQAEKIIHMLIDRPSLSIIVPNYNNELYVQDCIESILKQTYKNIEVIISDDASTDQSLNIIKKYEHLYGNKIKGIYHDVNRGVSFNRHSAITMAKGEYITTIDSDDYYYDDKKLETEMGIVLAHREKSNKDVCAFSNIVLVNKDKELLQVVGNSGTIREGKLFDGIITRDCFIPRDFILPKSAYFEVGGFDQTLRIYEDWDLKIRLAAQYEFYYSGISGVGYRRHGSGLSSASLSEHVEALEKIFKKNIPLARDADKKSLVDRFGVFMLGLQGNEGHVPAKRLQREKRVNIFRTFQEKLKSFIS